MANPRLSLEEVSRANNLMTSIRDELSKLAGGDKELLFAYRRRLITKLIHDERGTPAQRNKLKAIKLRAQNSTCPLCNGERGPLPLKYAELDRAVASAGYTPENTRLVHHECHIDDQRKRRNA
jgi:hypothetical protein